MEVEFLSNMRYSLYVGDAEWKEWHTKLGRFAAYWERASRRPLEPHPRASAPAFPPRAILAPPLLPFPSPPPSTSASPPFSHARTPPPHPMYLPAPVAQEHMPPILPQPDFDAFSRKRSFDYSCGGIAHMQPPSKRAARAAAPALSVHVPVQRAMDGLLPPLPGRSMAMVYAQHSPAAGPPTHYNFSPSMSYGGGSRSPYSAHHSVGSSPITPIFGHHQQQQQQQQRSPTWILGNRESPYRPVRGVNTLLVPPPHIDAQPPQIAYEQMHYQPLAKARAEYKTGVVPYHHQEVAWGAGWAEQPQYYNA